MNKKKSILKTGTKGIATLGIIISLSMASCVTALAGEDTNRMKLFGQELQVYIENEQNKRYVGIVEGADIINISDLETVDTSKTIQTVIGEIPYNAHKNKPFELKESNPSDIDSIVLSLMDGTNYHYMQYSIEEYDDYGIDANIYLFKMPTGYTSESLGDLSKYVIYANGSTSTTSVEGWVQDEIGRWYRNPDNSYPINTWKEIDGKQYYFGSDGYMLHDTITPDGYTVGSDGAWIETPETEEDLEVDKEAYEQAKRYLEEAEANGELSAEELEEWNMLQSMINH